MTPARILASLLLVTASAPLATATSSVYVTFDKRESLSRDKRRELADSASDLRDQLKKRASLESVDDERDADIRITILDRRIEVNESGRNDWGGALSQTHYQSRYILFFRLESRQAIEESEIALAGAFVTWRRVAGVLAKDVEDWAQNHHPR